MPAGYVKLGAVGYSDKGDYSGTTTYNKFNVVHYQNGVYCCTVDNTIGIAPTVTSNWQVMIPSDNGHTILNSAGTAMASRINLQFDGLNVADDSSNNKTVVSAPVMTGATALANGTGGFVPTPQAGDNKKVLRGDGTWGTVASGSAWGVCTTSASTAAKTVTVTEFELSSGSSVVVKFANGNTAENMTLNVNSTGAVAVYHNGSALDTDLEANGTYLFVYNGTQYDLVGGGSGGTIVADDVSYDNTSSGLTATNVQDAIDEVNSNVIGFVDSSSILTAIASRGASWTATDDGFIMGTMGTTDANDGYAKISIDNVEICQAGTPGFAGRSVSSLCIPIKKGQTLTTRSNAGYYEINVFKALK